jgi:hypothetical protein
LAPVFDEQCSAQAAILILDKNEKGGWSNYDQPPLSCNQAAKH